jgi:hypothetical protein
MNGVNLIPRGRMAVRLRNRRVRLWATGAGACALVLLAAYGVLRAAWGGSPTELAAEANRLAGQLQTAKSAATRAAAAEHDLRTEAEAVKSFAAQPDWGRMLSLVASKLGPNAVLDACTLEPVTGKPDGTRGGKAASSHPGRYTLRLSGVAKTQDTASQVALDLKGTGLFEDVRLETRLAPFMSTEAVAFQVRCDIVDSAGDRP